MVVIDRLLRPDAPWQRRFFFLAKRFVAGESIESALAAVDELNAAGLTATLDFLGEDVTHRDEAVRTRDVYLDLIGAIERGGQRTNVSVKLSALGLLIDDELARENLRRIVDRVRASSLADPFVRVDMEGSALVDRTLAIVERTFKETDGAVGPVLQAYLKRTPADVERMIELGARVRLCKGAYNEPPAVAHQAMATIRREYLRLAEALLARGRYPAIATHDERLIEAVAAFAREHGIDRRAFEFQLLYGVRPDVQRRLVAEGHAVRVYVPFGTHWAGYFYRRVTERRENAWLALRALLGPR